MAKQMRRISGMICVLAGLAFILSISAGRGVGWAQMKGQSKTVDLNSASQKELESLPGVGPATAKKIIANRPYKSVDELSKAGLSRKAVDKLKPMVTVGAAPATPSAATQTPAAKAPASGKAAAVKPSALKPGEKININTASKEQLEALPGIGPARAQGIIDGRPYKAPEDIMKVKGIKQGIYNKIKDNITVR